MYQIHYADIQSDSLADARERERFILDRSIALQEKAQHDGTPSFAAVEALHYTGRVWTAFLEDLACDDNMLAKEQRAALISIGIWILREIDSIREDPGKDFASLIEISKIIREGFNEKPV